MSHALDVVRDSDTVADRPPTRPHPLAAVPAALALAAIVAVAASSARSWPALALLAAGALLGALLAGAASDVDGRRTVLGRAAVTAALAAGLLAVPAVAPGVDLHLLAAALAGAALALGAPAAAGSVADLLGTRAAAPVAAPAVVVGVLLPVVLAGPVPTIAIALLGAAVVLAVAETVPSRQTPRLRLPLGVGVVASHREQRVRARVGAGAGALAALAVALQTLVPAVPAVALAAAVAGIAALAAGAVLRATAPDRPAEAAGHVLVGLALGTGTAAVAAGTLGGAPGAAVATGIAVLLAALAVLGGRARPASAALAGPGSRTYRDATTGFERAVRLAPERAAVVRRAEHVADAVGAARAAGLRIATTSTGHAAASVAPLDGAALLRVVLDEPVTVDPERRLVRVPAGTPWGVVAAAVAPHGLAVPHGSSPHVGVVGYLLRGGLSFYGRTTGVAANVVESIELVDAAGRLVVVDRERDPELFWALRGGGGGFGIVTAVTVRAFPVTALQTGAAVWSIEHAPALLAAWEAWTADAPREAATSFRVMRLPALPGVPRSIAARPIVTVDGVVHSRGADGGARAAEVTEGLLAPLRRIAEPLLDTWRPAQPLEVKHTHMDPTVPLRYVGDHLLLRDLGADGRAALLAAASSTAAGLDTIELRQLGGAFGERPDDAGVVGSFDAATAFFASGALSRRVAEADVLTRLGALRDAVTPWSTGLTAPTFATDRRFPQRSFDPATAARVDAVRRRVDPDGVFAIDVARGAAGE